jgi:hypothetical protein
VVLSLTSPSNGFLAPGSDFQAISDRLQVGSFLFTPLVLVLSNYRRSIADVFRIQVVSNSDVRSPIITLGSTSFFHVRVNNLYVVCVTKYVPYLELALLH